MFSVGLHRRTTPGVDKIGVMMFQPDTTPTRSVFRDADHRCFKSEMGLANRKGTDDKLSQNLDYAHRPR